jgi:hypothetical protein
MLRTRRHVHDEIEQVYQKPVHILTSFPYFTIDIPYWDRLELVLLLLQKNS